MKKENKDCTDCEFCIYVGESTSVCTKTEKVVLEDYAPADDFMCCCGKKWLKQK